MIARSGVVPRIWAKDELSDKTLGMFSRETTLNLCERESNFLLQAVL